MSTGTNFASKLRQTRQHKNNNSSKNPKTQTNETTKQKPPNKTKPKKAPQKQAGINEVYFKESLIKKERLAIPSTLETL